MGPNIEIAERARFNELYAVISQLYQTIGFDLFTKTWLGYLILFIVAVGASLFVWSWVKGLL